MSENEFDSGQQNKSVYENVKPDIMRHKMNPVITLASVVIGIVAIVFLKMKNDLVMALFCVGSVWIIFGIGLVVNENFLFKKHAMNTLYPIIGFFLVLITGYILLTKNISSLPKIEGKLLSMVIGAGISLIGVLILILNGIAFNYLKKICTEQVQAVCVYKKRGVGRQRNKYAPVFEFQFRDNTYYVAENYRIDFMPSIGSSYDLFINPHEPKEFYRMGDFSRVAIRILCMLLILLGGLVCLVCCFI
ncbi:MAG: hypothetical protein K2K96_10100 [Lachnospiraceae bacterium]|nr:hypothetical protein [Lachnospiraceae bacterium]